MGTRGVYGFRKDGVDKLAYNHFDSNPSCLGADVVEFAASTRVEDMTDIFNRIILVDERTKPTAEQIEKCEPWTDLSVSSGSSDDWYCLLRKAQGNLYAYTQGLDYMGDHGSFIKYSQWCEYGYIINLDEGVLEFWTGFQRKADLDNRYGIRMLFDYYPCRLVRAFPLSDLSSLTVAQMIEAENDK